MTCRVVRAVLILSGVTDRRCVRRPPLRLRPRRRRGPQRLPITDGRSLVSAMRQKYSAQWYKTLSFTQNNTLYSARGGATNSQWRQHIAVPGRLRIDYLPLSQRSGVLFDGSRVHTFDNGRAIDAQPGVNAQLLVTADVYALPLERSTQLLDSLGFDLSKLRRDAWEGQSAYVVGAAAGDSTTSQFWIDSVKLVDAADRPEGAARHTRHRHRRSVRQVRGLLRHPDRHGGHCNTAMGGSCSESSSSTCA